MEEADLLKERLQAITDKRRVQEDIAKKRRQIDEEKLKLQYIKKKALREHWLMDGLSQQTKEEQEAMRLQAQDEQQQSAVLQSNIDRIDKEIEALEIQELKISANEEVILKRLKEVERTAEDIIKELNAEFEADPLQYIYSPVPDVPITIQPTPLKTTQSPKQKPDGEEPKKATFAMEISVERDMRTGESQVVSMATVTPQEYQEKGVKVYDDGRKTVYALNPDGCQPCSGAVGEMTTVEVEELLRQATDKKFPSDIQYHQPVYSAPYTGSSRPSTPRTPNKTPRHTPSPSPSPFHMKTVSRNGSQSLREESQLSQEPPGYNTTSKIPSPSPFQQDTMSRDGAQSRGEETKQSHIPNLAHTDNHLLLQSQAQSPRLGTKTPQSLTNGRRNTPTLVSVTARSEGMPSPMHTFYRTGETHSPLPDVQKSGDGHSPAPLVESTIDSQRQSPFYPESEASFNFVNSLADDLESGPITMIFMGYQNAEDEDEEEDIHAELVVICNSDDDEEEGDKNGKNDNGTDEFLSYHPEGYKSKIFRPKFGVAKVAGHRDVLEEAFTNCDDVLPHKPTFAHKPGKRSPCPDRQGVDEPTNPGSLIRDKMKCCSTERS